MNVSLVSGALLLLRWLLLLGLRVDERLGIALDGITRYEIIVVRVALRFNCSLSEP